ncbi:MAG: preprotein translocase subunit SecY [Sphaerochaetaceae bacterium]|nr:preprotein translocase subunit SecY [Sphaerochaetaceae bacterium]
MSNTISDMFKMEDLRKKILFTLLVLAITRVGTVIPVPGVNPTLLEQYFLSQSASGNLGIVEYLNFFSGGAFSNFSLFTLGVMPYISMQIIIQLLMLIIPKLKAWGEDADGRRKIQKVTRYGTIVVCLLQSFVVTVYARSISYYVPGVITIDMLPFTLISMLTVTAGSMTLVWLGEKITQSGIGNGISLLIYAGIVARVPSAFGTIIQGIAAGKGSSSYINPVLLVIVIVVFIIIVALVVCEEAGERKIPVNYAKRVVGRKMYGAQSSYIPFKINPSGVIPVIFASSVLTFPIQIASALGSNVKWLQSVANWLDPQGAPYIIIYTILIIAFAFFYTQVSLNPVEMAKQIRENGGSVPGVRSDKLEEYLTKVLNRIVLPGSLFLAFIALVPTLIQLIFKFPSSVAMLFGGTSLIILVGVTIETVKQVESIMKMHHHEGFLGVKKIKSKSL